MKKFLVISLSFFFIFLFVSNLSAQQWSDEQKAVWAGVDTYWKVGLSDNPDDFLNYFDDTYHGWSYQNGAPGTKADVQKSMNYWNTKGKMKYYTITPATIWVNGNFAYVHYYYTQVSEGTDGKPMTERGRWTDILMKKGDKWMLVGDHGGEIKEKN